MLIKVEVTKEDIEKGQRKKSKSCPIFFALKRIGFKRFEVGSFCVVSARGKATGLTHPKKVSDTILAFDHGAAMKPFRYTWAIEDELAEKFGLSA
jgi:hypothetical protein